MRNDNKQIWVFETMIMAKCFLQLNTVMDLLTGSLPIMHCRRFI